MVSKNVVQKPIIIDDSRLVREVNVKNINS